MKRLFAVLLVAMLFIGYVPAQAATPITDDAVAYGYCKAHDMNYLPEATNDIGYGCTARTVDVEFDIELVDGVQYIGFRAISDDQSVFWDRIRVEYMTAYAEAQVYFKEHPDELEKVAAYVEGCETNQDSLNRALGK